MRRHKQELSPISSLNEIPDQSRIQYEVVDEDGNPLAINGIQNLIQMSGVRAREVTQPDGSIVKEYVIDDPQILSKFHSQQSQQASPITTSYVQHSMTNNDAPPPPPRVPLRQPLLFRQGPSNHENFPVNIQQIRALEPQRRYEFLTSSGRRVQFTITNIDDYQGQPISDSDIRELTTAIDTRIGVTRPPPPPVSKPISQAPISHPKTWNPSVDFTQRTASNRQRIGSDTQPGSGDFHNTPTYHQTPNDLVRSASYGALNRGTYLVQGQPQHQQVYNPTDIDWSSYRQPVVQNQFDKNLMDQTNQLRSQNKGPFQTTAQFLPQPQQTTITRSINSPSNNQNVPVYYQQTTPYSYQGQQDPQQQNIRYMTNMNGYDLSQARFIDSNTRI